MHLSNKLICVRPKPLGPPTNPRPPGPNVPNVTMIAVCLQYPLAG